MEPFLNDLPEQPGQTNNSQPQQLYRHMPDNLRRILWKGKVLPAFWTVASVVSISVNILLVVILLLLARQLFTLKSLISNQLVGGLHQNFVRMDDAHIKTTILVNDTITVSDTIMVKDTIPVVFNLPLVQTTEVRLTEDTPVNGTTIYLNGAAIPLNLVLPKGQRLNIHMEMTVPVSQTVPVVLKVPVNLRVPVTLKVPVDIPLNQTELHEPFTGLQQVVAPYDQLLAQAPNSWNQTPLCRPWLEWVCNWLINR